ncbi:MULTISPECIES: hypothetical protein [unclassified Streptomyces]|uniref:hypothetical protein n=1 Tax=unclassified Streptomyces TaxID=2593676 RepID=UPI0033D31BC8
MTAHLTNPTAHGLAPDGAGRVRTPSGRLISAATARRVHDATPANTQRSRTSRTDAFAAWCTDHGRVGTDPGTLPDWAAHLADLGYRAESIESYTGAMAATLAISGAPLDAEDRSYLRAIINSRHAEQAQDRSGAGDVLQVAECTREDLAAMLATRDRATLAGLRDSFGLSLAWYMAGRASEPPCLHIEDVREVMAELDDDTGGVYSWPALEIRLRLSKTNPHGRTLDVVRILAQDDATCPVLLHRQYAARLAAAEITTGPLLRRVKNERFTTAGRPSKDPSRAGGWGDRALRNLIGTCAKLAGLTGPELTAEERELLSTTAERAALAELPDETDAREALRADVRRRRRELRARRTRYAGHSMRRGQVRDQQRRGVPRHLIEQQCRYRPGSRALDRYLDPGMPWADNPTRPRRRRP